MARKKKKRKSSGINAQKIFKYVRLAALAAPAAGRVMGWGSPQEKMDLLMQDYTGFSPTTGVFKADRLMRGWGAYAAAVAVTYGIPKLAGMIRGI